MSMLCLLSFPKMHIPIISILVYHFLISLWLGPKKFVGLCAFEFVCVRWKGGAAKSPKGWGHLCKHITDTTEKSVNERRQRLIDFYICRSMLVACTPHGQQLIRMMKHPAFTGWSGNHMQAFGKSTWVYQDTQTHMHTHSHQVLGEPWPGWAPSDYYNYIVIIHRGLDLTTWHHNCFLI